MKQRYLTILSALIVLFLLSALTLAQGILPLPRTGGDARFDPTGWIYPQNLEAAADDYFGFSTAVTGTTVADAILVIGAPNANVSGHNNAGRIYIYFANAEGDGWDFHATLTSPAPSADAQFGYAIDVVNNGSSYLLAVGSPGATIGATANAGKIYVFRSDGSGGWNPPQTLVAPLERIGRYGASVALHDFGDNVGHLLVGEPEGVGNVHFYTQFGGAFGGLVSYEAPDFNAGFGYAVGFIDDVDAADFYVTAPYQDESEATNNGALYIYEYDGISSRVLAQTIYPNSLEDSILFGWSVSAHRTPTDNLLAVGAPGAMLSDGVSTFPLGGYVELLTYNGTDWVFDDDIEPPLPYQDAMFFGAAVDILQRFDNSYSLMIGQPEALLDGATDIRKPGTPGVVHHYQDDDGFGDSDWDFFYHTNLVSGEAGVSDYYGYAIEQGLLDNQQYIFIGAPETVNPIVDGAPGTGGVDTYYPTQPDLSSITTDGTLDIGEDGTTDEVSLMLRSSPADGTSVTVQIISDTQCNAYQPIITRPPDLTLTFSDSDWNILQSVSIEAEDDTDVEGPHTCTISFILTSADPAYNGLVVTPLSVNITDNDAPVGIELVRNPSMETPHPIKPIKPEFWMLRKFAGQDKRVCPGAGSPKVYSGSCSMQIAGSKTGPSTVFRSTRTQLDMVDILGISPSIGDTVRVQFVYKLSGVKSNPLFRLVTFRNFGGDWDDLARVELPHPSDSNYNQWLTFDQTYPLVRADFKQLRFILKDLSTGGRWWVDDVSMTYIEGAVPSNPETTFRAP